MAGGVVGWGKAGKKANLSQLGLGLSWAWQNLKNDYAHTIDNCDKACARIEYLEAELSKTAIKHENDTNSFIETLQHKVMRNDQSASWRNKRPWE